MFGREARTPFMSQMPQVDVTGWDRESKSYFFQHQEKLRKAHDLAKLNHSKYREQMAKQTSKKGTQAPFSVGSRVWCLIPTESRHKLSVNYDGPWKVTKNVGNTYVVEKDGVTMRVTQIYYVSCWVIKFDNMTYKVISYQKGHVLKRKIK